MSDILVVEDESGIAQFVAASLSAAGMRPRTCATARDAEREIRQRAPDLVILDLGLPDEDGVRFIARMRPGLAAPVLVLSARSQEAQKIEALDAGADDYLTKPFGVGELLARMRVALRHAARVGHEGDDPIFTVGELRVDLAQRHVQIGAAEIHLTPIEYKLLTTLIEHAGKVLTHQMLLRQVWGPAYTDEAHYLRVYVGQLRHKLEANPARPRYLLTEPGVGYRLAAE